MKRTLSLILALILCLSLCACGGGEQNNETQDGGNSTINNGNGSTHAPESGTTNTTENTENTPKSITVEITPDNWSEYFEIVESREYVVDDFGDFLYVTRRWDLVLKKDYSIQNNYKLIMEVQYNTYYTDYEVNHETKDFTLIGEPRDIESHTEKMTIQRYSADWLDNNWWGNIELAGGATTIMTSISDFQVLRVAGDTTIELLIISE